MRWEQLFADLEAQYDELAEAALWADLADRQRLEFGAVGMVARLLGAVEQPVRLRAGAVTVSGILKTVGPDWVLVAEAPGRDAVVALAHLTIAEGLTAKTGRPLGPVAQKLTLRSALRGLARDRAPVSLVLADTSAGQSAGAGDVTGTLDRIGADFVEMAVHAAWELRRPAGVRRSALVPLPAIAVVRSQPLG